MSSPFGSGRRVDLNGVSVMIAMPAYRDVPPETVKSLMETVSALVAKGVPHGFEMEVGCSIAAHARSKTAHRFLKNDYTHLFWIDSDITWTAAEFLQTLALGTKMDVVVGSYPAKRLPIQFMLQPEDHKQPSVEANEWGCIPIGGAGLGFTVLTREIVQKLADKAAWVRFPDSQELMPYLFRNDILNVDGDLSARGEDMAFFSDIRDLGYRIWLNPKLELGHIGPRTYSGSLADFLREGPPSREIKSPAIARMEQG